LSSRDREDRQEFLTAERRRFVEIILYVIHVNVNHNEILRFVAERRDVAIDAAARSGVDHGRRREFLRVPVEELGEKLRAARLVPAADFEVNNGTPMAVSLAKNFGILPQFRVKV